MISHIAAVSKDLVIGKGNQLPWRLPLDLKMFKERTKGKCVVMGRKTFDSIGRPLPGRLNVVITRNPTWNHPGTFPFTDFDEAIKFCKEMSDKYGEEIMIIGGEEIYKKTLPLADRLYLTEVDTFVPDGDAFYPPWDEFDRIDKQDFEDNGLKFSVCTYKKKENT